jgi:hypothetical protein
MERPPSRLPEILGQVCLHDSCLQVADLKEGRTDREIYFNAVMKKDGLTSLNPVIQGLYFEGRDKFIKPWLEFRYSPYPRFPDGLQVLQMDLEESHFLSALLERMCLLVGPGGSLMVIYGGENHPLFLDTEKGLKLGFPPAATPLGFHLWKSGCRWFKDWYFSEGWKEGAMKLQASYPLNEVAAGKGTSRIAGEASMFILDSGTREPSRLLDEALARAKHITAFQG